MKRRIPPLKAREYQDEEPRFYTREQLAFAGFRKVRHEKVPSVTTIMQAKAKGFGFQLWLGNAKSYRAAKRHKDKRADIGLAVHHMIANHFNGVRVRRLPGTKRYFENFLSFVAAYQPKAKAVEKIVYQPDLGYAGTTDFVGTVLGRVERTAAKVRQAQLPLFAVKPIRVLIDWKTTKTKHPKEHQPQAAAYRAAFDQGVAEVWVVYLAKRREFRPSQIMRITPEQADRAFHAFEHVFEVWKWENDWQEELVRRAPSKSRLTPVRSIISARTRPKRRAA